MCGIAGIVGEGAASHVEAVRRMVDSLKHRGPDGEGIHIFPSGRCVLGHRRLAILDLTEAASQPMLTEDRRFGLVYNGECYNFPELREELVSRGERFRSTGDTEVVLKILTREGASALPRLNAMFALALWDERELRLLIARDRFGQKPLYYTWRGGLFIFASEVRALLASGLVERRANPEGIISYLSFGAVQEPGTILKNVKLLSRASWLEVKEGREELHSYWSPPREKRSLPPEELREEFKHSVARHLISDVPVGVFLSGGIDSSAVAMAAAQVSDAPVHTLCVVYPEAEELSEARYARKVAEKAGSVHQEIPIAAEEIISLLPKALASMDQPTLDAINTYVVSMGARNAGLKVALSGLGGDELFGGYSSFRHLPLMVRMRWLASLLKPASPLLSALGRVFSKRLGKICDFLEAPPDLLNYYVVRRRLFSSRQIKTLAPQLTNHKWINGLPPEVENAARTIINNREIHDATGLLEMSLYMGQVLLRDSDVMGMAHGLEIRLPFLDARFAELALELPPAARRHGLPLKKRFVEALGDWLPEEITTRPKQGFLMPFHDWIKHDLQEEVKGGIDYLARETGEIFNPSALHLVLDLFLRPGHHLDWSRPWALFILGRYLETHRLVL